MHPAIIELQNRGLINQSTDISIISKQLENGSSVYCGFDPTADSLHIGSLLPLMTLKVLKDYGVQVIALVGGATGRIGDPSFKTQERQMLEEDTVEKNISGIKNVIKHVLGKDTLIVNNYDWTKDLSVLDFLRIYGKCFTVNNMIAKDSVRSRIERPDQGISFTEFTYPILQGMDFEHLHSIGCSIQIGGSDQWGNMIAGIDLIHKLHGNDTEVGVITLPLLLKSDGTKFGKSESGTIWLSEDKTSAYDMYQFWLNISDEEMYKMHSYFKPLALSVESLKERMQSSPVDTKKQFALAMTSTIHGYGKASIAVEVSNFIFGNSSNSISQAAIDMMIESGMEPIVVDDPQLIVATLVESGLATSNKMAREFITTGAAKINGRKINEFYDHSINEFIEDINYFDKKYFILQRGRKDFVIIKNRN